MSFFTFLFFSPELHPKNTDDLKFRPKNTVHPKIHPKNTNKTPKKGEEQTEAFMLLSKEVKRDSRA